MSFYFEKLVFFGDLFPDYYVCLDRSSIVDVILLFVRM